MIAYVVEVYDFRPQVRGAGGNVDASTVVGVVSTEEAARELAERDAVETERVSRDEVVCIGGNEWRASRGYDFDDGEERSAKWNVLYSWKGFQLDPTH